MTFLVFFAVTVLIAKLYINPFSYPNAISKDHNESYGPTQKIRSDENLLHQIHLLLFVIMFEISWLLVNSAVIFPNTPPFGVFLSFQ